MSIELDYLLLFVNRDLDFPELTRKEWRTLLSLLRQWERRFFEQGEDIGAGDIQAVPRGLYSALVDGINMVRYRMTQAGREFPRVKAKTNDSVFQPQT